MKGLTVLILIEALFIIGHVCLFVTLYLGFARSEYDTQFEMTPQDPSLLLSCADNPSRYWAAAANGATEHCIFTGDFTKQEALSEKEVRELCSTMSACAGYVVKQTVSSSACSGETPSLSNANGCIQNSYNNSQPEYILLPKAAADNLVPQPKSDTFRHTRTVTYIRR